jgi:hypothetical protein
VLPGRRVEHRLVQAQRNLAPHGLGRGQTRQQQHLGQTAVSALPEEAAIG